MSFAGTRFSRSYSHTISITIINIPYYSWQPREDISLHQKRFKYLHSNTQPSAKNHKIKSSDMIDPLLKHFLFVLIISAALPLTPDVAGRAEQCQIIVRLAYWPYSYKTALSYKCARCSCVYIYMPTAPAIIIIHPRSHTDTPDHHTARTHTPSYKTPRTK